MYISKPSGEVSTSQSVYDGAGLITHAQAGDQTLTIYDSTTASGTIVAIVDAFDHADYEAPLHFKNGIFASVASTTSTFGAVINYI